MGGVWTPQTPPLATPLSPPSCREGVPLYPAIGSGRANCNLSKYAELAYDYILQPIAVENLGSFDSSASSFLSNLGNKIRASSGEDKETLFLLQRISVLIQRFISVLLHDSFIKDGPDQ